MKLHSIVLGFFLLLNFNLNAQHSSAKSSSELYLDLQKLNFLGRVMYIAAHPDDENTRLISYLTHQTHAKTAYLAMTRGDGGQNLIGTEIRELLGVLRTEELLKARSIDGGEQYFTRAIDFGYSKHPDETLRIWNKEDLLTDIIDRIRLFKPDVIINRFDHRSPGTTHGHHTTSAMLSVEAFDLVDNTEKYPLRVATKSWKPKRMFLNTSWWFYGSREAFKKANHNNLVKLDVGTYYPSLGVSNNELAALASSQHLCQGFGRLLQRGSEEEYLELIKGEHYSSNDLFDGIDTSWNRIKGGQAVEHILKPLEENFNFNNPSLHTPTLLKAYKALSDLENSFWKTEKLKELSDFILAVNGVYIDINSTKAYTNPGYDIEFVLEAINRSDNEVHIQSIESNFPLSSDFNRIELPNNKKITSRMKGSLDKDVPYNSPYWLEESTDGIGMYRVSDASLIGLPNTPSATTITFILSVNGVELEIDRPLTYKIAQPDKGEVSSNFGILPALSLKFKDQVSLITSEESKTIQLEVKALRADINGSIQLELPVNWKSIPNQQAFSFSKEGESIWMNFELIPSKDSGSYTVAAKALVDGKTYTKQHIIVDYDHIPKQDVLLPTTVKAVKLDLKKEGNRIAYIMGAGDQIPNSLEQIGYQVDLLEIDAITSKKLSSYDAVVLGVRVYNVHPELRTKQQYLLDYVFQGGNLITQYNTSGRSSLDLFEVAPYPLELSRDRVAEEDAQVRFALPKHPVLNFPNKITKEDFENWVQERGLYFPIKWDDRYAAPLEMNDLGESPKRGSLLIAAYGKGNYIYTGLSFFRELPAGVPGAYKLFANIIALKNNK